MLEPQNWSPSPTCLRRDGRLDVQTSTNDYFAYQDLVETASGSARS